MFSAKSVSVRRSRANALSIAIISVMAFGFAPAEAQAVDVVVEGTVDGCVIEISQSSPVDLGTPQFIRPEGTAPYYLFGAQDAINVAWSTGDANSCGGELHAKHAGITRTAGASTTPALSGRLALSLYSESYDMSTAGWVILNAETSSAVATSEPGADDSSWFDVALDVESTEGQGVFRSTITFTVVPD